MIFEFHWLYPSVMWVYLTNTPSFFNQLILPNQFAWSTVAWLTVVWSTVARSLKSSNPFRELGTFDTVHGCNVEKYKRKCSLYNSELVYGTHYLYLQEHLIPSLYNRELIFQLLGFRRFRELSACSNCCIFKNNKFLHSFNLTTFHKPFLESCELRQKCWTRLVL